MTDKPRCNCGVVGVYGAENASVPVYYALHSLQHRGQEAAGIITTTISDKVENFKMHKGFGLVSEVFANNKLFTESLTGNVAIGHNRYSTTGSSDSEKNIQPFVVNYRLGKIALAHNGNITNAKKIRQKLVEDGAIFQTSSDSEVLLHLIARNKSNDQVTQIKEAVSKLEGAFSFVLMTDTSLIAARDPYGFRPLSIGKLNGGYFIASETCAFDINAAEYIRDVEPGELVVIDKKTLETGEIRSEKVFSNYPKKHCIFEYIYFSRPDSRIYGHNVDKMRRKLGKILAKNHPVRDKDGGKVIVISVPDSSNTAAIGYQNQLEKMGIASKLEIGLIRSHYIGRTFIIPGQQNREIGVRIKFNPVRGVLENRTVVLIDDSIVRGTTSKKLVELIRKEAAPKEIHLRIASSPIKHPCFYGMDFPSREELLANRTGDNMEKIREMLNVDSIEYMEIEEMLDAMVDHASDEFCTACFSGNYPTPVDTEFSKEEYDVI